VNASKQGPNFVHALAKGLEILSSFSEGEMLGNQQLVEITGLPKATVSRLTSTLVELGYLRIDQQSRKLMMGNRLLGMGISVQRKLGVQRCARPFMEAMSHEYGLTVSMGARDRLGLVVLEVSRPPDHAQLVVNFDAGTHLPLTKTSIGLACIVGAPVKERTKILEELHERSGSEWSEVRTRIEQAHREYEKFGFVVSQRSIGREVSGVAVPMGFAGHKASYAFNFAGPSNRMSLAYMRKELGPRLQAMVRDIQAVLATSKPPRLVLPTHLL
jgi:DNA-binding IclR family transcriptional regulator